MDRKRKLTLGAATLAVALGAGHLVQSGISQAKTEQRSVSAGRTSTSPTGITQLAASVKPNAAAHGARPASRLAEAAALAAETAIPASFVPEPPLAATAVDAEVSATCRATLDIIPAANAVLDLVLLAPCHPDTRVVLRHGGLAITGQTSAGGALFVSIPAIESSGARKAITASRRPTVCNRASIASVAASAPPLANSSLTSAVSSVTNCWASAVIVRWVKLCIKSSASPTLESCTIKNAIAIRVVVEPKKRFNACPGQSAPPSI